MTLVMWPLVFKHLSYWQPWVCHVA